MTICEKCGAELPEGARFCHMCGMSTAEQEEFVIDSDHLIQKIKELIHEGNVRRRAVKNPSIF
jgi:uncharacterized membrane protein YvbJ